MSDFVVEIKADDDMLCIYVNGYLSMRFEQKTALKQIKSFYQGNQKLLDSIIDAYNQFIKPTTRMATLTIPHDNC